MNTDLHGRPRTSLTTCARHIALCAWAAVFLACGTFAGCGKAAVPGVPAAKQSVVVYSPHGKEVLGDYEKLFEAANPGVDVQMFDLGANDILNRVRAEKGRPAGDVWWGAPSTNFVQAAGDGLLAPYKPTWADAVAAEYRDRRTAGTARTSLRW